MVTQRFDLISVDRYAFRFVKCAAKVEGKKGGKSIEKRSKGGGKKERIMPIWHESC